MICFCQRGEDNLVGLLNMILKINGKKPIDTSFLKAAKDMLDLVAQIDDMIGSTGEIYLGEMVGLGTKAAQRRCKRPPPASQRWGARAPACRSTRHLR